MGILSVAAQMVLQQWLLLQRPCDIRCVSTGAELISAPDGGSDQFPFSSCKSCWPRQGVLPSLSSRTAAVVAPAPRPIAVPVMAHVSPPSRAESKGCGAMGFCLGSGVGMVVPPALHSLSVPLRSLQPSMGGGGGHCLHPHSPQLCTDGRCWWGPGSAA